MRSAACIAIVLFVVPVALTASPVCAQSRDVALARQLFDEGVGFADEHDWENAADRFQRSLELRPSPIVAYNLGSAFVELGRLVEASEAFRITIRNPETPEEVSRAARNTLQSIEPRIGRLTIELSGDTDDVQVFIDGRDVPPQAIGVAAPADPGTRQLHAERDGEHVASAEVVIEDGARADVTLEIPAREVAAPEGDPILGAGSGGPVENDEGGGIFSSPWFWVATGVIVVGAVALVLALTLTGGDDGQPIPGNLTPAVVEF